MLFLSLSNVDFQFSTRKLTQRSYTSAEALSTARQEELFDKYKFANATLDKNSETFIIHVSVFKVAQPILSIYLFQTPLLAILQQDKVLTKILVEYVDYAVVFFADLAIELPKNTSINKHVIELVEGKQLLYRLIYSLSFVELETLKAYVKTHLKTEFIQSSKSPASATLLFDKKLDRSLRLYMHY